VAEQHHLLDRRRPGGDQLLEQLVEIGAALEGAKKRRVPAWLELDAANFKGTVRTLPSKEEMAIPVQEQLVVALYSK